MRCEASTSLSTMCFGVGPSGLPIDRSLTSSPARRADIFSSLVMLKTYGGSRLILENSRISGIIGERCRRPAEQLALRLADQLILVAGRPGGLRQVDGRDRDSTRLEDREA